MHKAHTLLVASAVFIQSGCTVMLDKGSIEQSPNVHYVEIDAGGLTPKESMVDELKKYSLGLCSGPDYEIRNYEIHSRADATLPGKTCRTVGCIDHFVLKAIVACNAPTRHHVNITSASEILELPSDKERFNDLFMGDRMMNGIRHKFDLPDKAISNQEQQVFWIYEQKQFFVEFIRKRDMLIGWQSTTMTIRKGIPARLEARLNHHIVSDASDATKLHVRTP